MYYMNRRHLNVRLADEGMARLEGLRDEYDITLTQVVRAVIAVAFKHPEEIRRTLSYLKEVK